jgi:hypothetical protein
MLGGYWKKCENRIGFQIENQFETLRYRIEWCLSWNPTTRFCVMWELDLWNSNQMYIYIELKPWHAFKKFKVRVSRFQGFKLIK